MVVARFLKRHPEVIASLVLLTLVGTVALFAAFGGGMEQRQFQTPPQPTSTFQFDGPEPASSSPVPVARACEEIMADVLNVQADALEVDPESAGASARIAALNRRLGVLLREQSAAGCS